MEENEIETSPPSLPYKASLWFWVSAASVVLSFIIGLLFLIFILPVFIGMFAELGAALPQPTLMLIHLSNWMKSYFFLLQLPLIALLALNIWVLYELDKRKQNILVIIIGNIPPGIVIVMIGILFLPFFAL